MNCNETKPMLHELSRKQRILLLQKERNEFAKSRQQWIQAAFDLDRGDNTLFKKLMVDELCDNCIEKYSFKTEL